MQLFDRQHLTEEQNQKIILYNILDKRVSFYEMLRMKKYLCIQSINQSIFMPELKSSLIV